MVTLKNPFIKTETERITYVGSKEVQHIVDLSQNRNIDAGSAQLSLGFPINLTRYIFQTEKGEQSFVVSDVPADDLRVGEECNLERRYFCLGRFKIEVGKKVTKI